jgi:hypothetical protein
VSEEVKAVIELVGTNLVDAFNNWLDVNRDRINPRLYNRLRRELRKVNTSTVPGVMGAALWMLNILGNMGCLVTVGLDGFQIIQCDNFDRRATERLAILMYTAFKLQFIPPELGTGGGR